MFKEFLFNKHKCVRVTNNDMFSMVSKYFIFSWFVCTLITFYRLTVSDIYSLIYFPEIKLGDKHWLDMIQKATAKEKYRENCLEKLRSYTKKKRKKEMQNL